MSGRRVPTSLIARLALAVVLDTTVQVLWKVAAARLPGSLSFAALAAAAHEPLFLVVGVLFLWQLVNWLQVLEASDLSFSQPITSLSLVTVLAVSALWLGETLNGAKLAGIGLVFAGVWLITRTDHRSGAGQR